MSKSLLFETKPPFNDFYNGWRVRRVQKLLNLLGADWFKGKSVLEMGCGYGNIGLFLKSLGADVTFSDARQECLDIVLSKDRNVKTFLIDQDKDWALKRQYDLIVHFGISYNLENWARDLNIAINHSKKLVYETAVNKYQNDVEFKIKNFQYGHEFNGAFNGIGSLVSVVSIENLFNQNKVEFQRFDDADLNFEGFIYNKEFRVKLIKHTENDLIVNSWADANISGGRKFWLVNNTK